MNIDTDELVKILKNDQPLSGFMVQDDGKDKVFILTSLPHLAEKVIEFANSLLLDQKNDGC